MKTIGLWSNRDSSRLKKRGALANSDFSQHNFHCPGLLQRKMSLPSVAMLVAIRQTQILPYAPLNQPHSAKTLKSAKDHSLKMLLLLRLSPWRSEYILGSADTIPKRKASRSKKEFCL
jgi:hypothetical protein